MKTCFCQEPYFRHFGVEQGLPSSQTYDVLQDRLGYIWISTDRGVSRYDSYSFRNFSSADGLTDNTVFFLEEDTAGNIWCATLNNQLCYFQGEKILPYAYNAVLQQASPQTKIIQSLDVTSRGDVVIGRQEAGCVIIDSSGKLLGLGNPLADSKVYEVFASDQYFIFGSIAVNNYQYSSQTFSIVVNGGAPVQVQMFLSNSPNYTTALRKANGTILVSTANLLLEVAPDGSYRLHEMEARIIRMAEDKAGNTWVSLYGQGVRRYAPGADLAGTGYRNFLIKETVTDILQDNEGSYWMTTLDHGVYYLASTSVHCLFEANSLRGISVTALTADVNGKMLVGTSGGWIIYDAGHSNREINCNVSPYETSIVQDICVVPGRKETWFCTSGRLMYIDSGLILSDVRENGMSRICTDGKDGYWMGGFNGMGHINRDSGGFDQRLRVNCWVQELYYDSVSEKVLVGGLDGLYWLNGDSLERYKIGDKYITSRVNAVRRSGDMLVVGTIGAGVCLIGDDTIITISTPEGLCSPMVNDLDVDRHGNIWAGTNAGVAQITNAGTARTVNCFSTYHGLPTNEVSRVFCNNDTVWIGTTAGAAWFVPGEIEHSPVAPPIYIQEVLINGQQVPSDSTQTFSHNENQVRFSFLGISYRNNGNTTYRYRLVGLEKDWTTTNNRSVEYASLPPGNYIFEVIASNGDATSSYKPALFGFSISKPFWMRWWFWMLLTVLLVTAAWWTINQRLLNIRNTVRQKGILAEYQHQALASQMNPHFIFNSLSSMQAFILGDEKENALRYIDRFSFLMRKSLEHSMLKFVPLEKEIELLRAYLDIEAMRFGDKLAYNITCAPSIDARHIHIPTMLIQPFAENAIRHGLMHREETGGQISISFSLQENNLWCCVEDNGVGRERSAEINRTRRKHISFGSSITEERLRLLCEVTGQLYSITYTDKTDERNHASGTTVHFIVPSRKTEPHVTRTSD